MYHGEVNIAQEELNTFLTVAEDLRVKGLTQSQSSSKIKEAPPVSKPFTGRSQDQDPQNQNPTKSERHQTKVVAEDDDIQEVVPVKSEPKDPSNNILTQQPVVYT